VADMVKATYSGDDYYVVSQINEDVF